MNNKKLGIVFVVLGVAISLLLFQMMGSLTQEAASIGCFEDESCGQVQAGFGITHFAFGFMGFLLALGFYLMFFNNSDEAILKRLEEQKQATLKEERFMLILKGLDAHEKEVVQKIKAQEGITQSTLRIRTAMSKAKLSYVLSGLEKKGLVKRVPKGKALSVYLSL